MKRTQGEKLNNLLVRAGVVWHDCDGCGRAWPFPAGAPDAERREWLCHACVQALWAQLQREKREVRMVESAEGIGGRKWSLDRVVDLDLHAEVVTLQQGKTKLATLTEDGEKVQALLATAPQLWEAANEVCLQWQRAELFHTPEMVALANMVAKAVGKTEFKDVKQ